MAVLVTQPDRESFSRCPRQWDFSARMRRNLEPVRPEPVPDLDRGLRAALSVYYFPGMWDWDRAVTLPLVLQGLEREFSRERERGRPGQLDPDRARSLRAGTELLQRYFGWAPAADRFSPVLVDPGFEVQVFDPGRPDTGLSAGPGGQPVRYQGRIDMLAIDQHDAYWIVRHRLLAGHWPAAADATADDALLTACWAWQQAYPGLQIAGTIHNEVHLTSAGYPPLRTMAGSPGSAPDVSGGRAARPETASHPGAGMHSGPGGPGAPSRDKPGGERGPGGRFRWPWRRQHIELTGAEPVVVRQHEPSGGGRSIPQHRRMYAVAREPAARAPVEQDGGPGFRRTWIRHSQDDIAAAGRQLGADVVAMLAAAGPVRANPSDANCRPCAFAEPCLAMRAGRDSEFLLRSGYRARLEEPEQGRLGGSTWGTGRGAAAFRRAR